MNPARDLGPRLLTSMVGYGKAVYTYRRFALHPLCTNVVLNLTSQSESHYWLWCPILGPVAGAQCGTIFYDAFLYNGEGNRFNTA
jgi:aquaglyceroporin related protein